MNTGFGAGKEPRETQKGCVNWYDYGARFYDPVIGRFHTQDRFAEKYLSMTPYQYGANNPISYIDINGDSIWHVNPMGYVSHTGVGDRNYSGTHTLHAVNDKGETGSSVAVQDGGILDQLAEETNIGENVSLGQPISGPVANTSNRDDAYNVFKFAAKNSKVEWSYQRYTDGTLSVATANENSTTIRGTDHSSNKGKTVAADVHSHHGSTKVDMKPSSPDITSRNYYLEKNPHVKVEIYIPNSPYPTARLLDIVNNKWINY